MSPQVSAVTQRVPTAPDRFDSRHLHNCDLLASRGGRRWRLRATHGCGP